MRIVNHKRSRRLKHKRVRIAIGVLAAFIALTAIGGGIAMLAGADQFPRDWLRDTPFSDYTLPALVLAIVVGGSSLVAAVPEQHRGRVEYQPLMASGLRISSFGKFAMR
jgi:hypothetical protein